MTPDQPGTSRRAFLRLSLALTGLTGVLATACQGPNSSPSKSPEAVASAPVHGGTLTWGQWDRNDQIDPAVNSGAAATEIIGNVLDTLLTMDADQKLYPSLASEWTVSPDSTIFTFTLRDNVTFHDGTQLVAATVKKNWDRLLDPATKAAGVVPLFGPVDAISAPDPRTLVVTFKSPNPLFPQQIWRPYFGIMSSQVLDALKAGEQVQTLVGSGPFNWGERSGDGVVTLKANRDYAWGSGVLTNQQAPYVEALRFRPITDAGTRVATLESGENLVIDELAEADFARLKGDSRFRFIQTPRRGPAIGFQINVQKAPTDDLAVRQAMNYAVDRKGIVDKLFFGVHKVAVGPLAEGVWGRWEGAEFMYGYDPKKAGQVLEDAGWTLGSNGIRAKGGQPLSLALATFRSPWTEIAEAIQAEYRAVGIDLQVQKMDRNAYLDYVRSYKHNVCASSGTNIDPDELRVRYGSAAIPASNFANLRDAQLDDLMNKGAQQALGSEERRQTYETIQRRFMEILPFVSVMSQVRIEASAARVAHLRMGADGLNALPLSDTWIQA